MNVASSVVRFSLPAMPKREQLTMLRDIYGPELNIEFTPLSDAMRLDGELRLLPGVSILHASNSPHKFRAADTSKENDDFSLVWTVRPGVGRMTQLGREIDGADGTAVLMSCCDPIESEMHSDFEPVIVRIDRTLLLPLLPRAEATLMRPIAADHPPFRLLNAYLGVLRSQGMPESAELARSIAAHICDLVALAVGTTRDATAAATERGARAARLATVKCWIIERLTQPDLSIAGAAAMQGVSPRYVQMLFESEGTTFSAFVLRERLALAHRRLTNPLLAAHPISQVAFDAGFGDLSYFNRAFRAAFGEAPSDARRRPVETAGV